MINFKHRNTQQCAPSNEINLLPSTFHGYISAQTIDRRSHLLICLHLSLAAMHLQKPLHTELPFVPSRFATNATFNSNLSLSPFLSFLLQQTNLFPADLWQMYLASDRRHADTHGMAARQTDAFTCNCTLTAS